jgi:salicylate hydroxylase
MENPDVWALFDHPPAPVFYKGRLCLLGDAAHATTPHQGAGAGQAIEDALVLSSLLGQVNCSADLEDTFKAYNAVRRPRSQRVVTTSREASHLYELENESIGYDLERARKELEVRCKWIWDEDLSAQVKKAQNAMVQEPLGRL